MLMNNVLQQVIFFCSKDELRREMNKKKYKITKVSEKRNEKGLSQFIEFCCSESVAPIYNNQETKFRPAQIPELLTKKEKNMLPFVSTTQTRPRNFESIRSSTVYNPASYEVLGANMPETAGILPLTLRVGNPLSSYKYNKIERARPNSDYVYFHLEKYCALDGLWYPQWLQLNPYGVIVKCLEKFCWPYSRHH